MEVFCETSINCGDHNHISDDHPTLNSLWLNSSQVALSQTQSGFTIQDLTSCHCCVDLNE